MAAPGQGVLTDAESTARPQAQAGALALKLAHPHPLQLGG